MKQVHLLIKGEVTGVGFRFNMLNIAEDLKVRGWCRNNSLSEVEAIAQGDEESLNNFITWCRQGPPGAKVLEVKIEWQDELSDFEGFTVKY